jgi:DNA polymerase III subunit alpha
MIHLHVHSTFSMLDGFGTAEQYADRLKEIGQTCMALTDHGNIYGHRAFAKVFEARGLKFIPGSEMYVQNTKGRYFHITVLARNSVGYENLCRLTSLANQSDHFSRRPQVLLRELRDRREGLVVLSGCFGDGIPHRAYQENREKVLPAVLALKRLFRDIPFYLEVQHHDKEELDYMRMIGALAKVKLCPTIDAHYPKKTDYEAEDLMLCIGQKERLSNPSRMRLLDTLWLMTEQEALEHFTPGEIAVTHEIADLCDVKLPVLQPVQIENSYQKIFDACFATAKRLGGRIKNGLYRERYLYEMGVIEKLGLGSYFVVMADVIGFFKQRGVFIGPARGSSAGSLVCYLLGITEVDPIEYGLSFERFLDINRKDYPDIDTDFPHDQRAHVIEYLKQTYGADRVGRLCSFTTYRGSSTFWDIARSYGLGPDAAREMGKAVPPLVNDEIDMQDILNLPDVQALTKKYPEFSRALDLENQVRQLGKHASGYAISPVCLSSVVSENLSKDEMVLSVDKYTAEEMGLLKLDILGLKTLDMIQEIMQDVGLKNTDLYSLEPTDPAVFEAFNKQRIAGIFQFEGASVRRALRAFKMVSLEDLSFINAVARPGASNAISGEIPLPEPVRRFVYRGKFFIYQEELMAILRWLNFSWADVTKFRKLVSRKKVTELRGLFYEKFVAELSKHVPEREAIQFWIVINKCGEYMFNKSHSIAYSMLAYISMWLKVQYPAVFVQAYLNHCDDDEKRRAMVRECVRMDWTVKIYDPEKSNDRFLVTDKTILGGLTSIKGIGPAKAGKIRSGKPDRGSLKAIREAEKNPAEFAPWAALDDFGNRYKLGELPEGEYMVKARVWGVDSGKCILEDAIGAEKAYFNAQFVHLIDGVAYTLAITKFKYARIDSAHEIGEKA